MLELPDVTLSQLNELAATLLCPEVIYFPVRHHSPACAWHLRKLIQEQRPSAILVEGPRPFSELIPFIVDERARAPFAIYTYFVRESPGETGLVGEKARFASYYPFCDYSPELVALREGATMDCDMQFIDLDYASQCAAELPDDEFDSLLAERHMRESSYLKLLARRMGCRDHDELWDHLFETVARELTTTEFMARVAAYCQLVRFDTAPEALARDATVAREAEMAWHVQQALARRAKAGDDPAPGPVLVVTGGFHTVVLPGLVNAGTERPKIDAGRISEQRAALIRYSFDRLDRLNGYAAGMPTPAWYQALWSAQNSTPRKNMQREVALGMLIDVAMRIRNGAEGLSTAALISALEQAERLARLRGRSNIARADLIDAIQSCFIKGAADVEGAYVLSNAFQVLAGNTIGTLPPGTGVPPLVRDFEHRARRHRLKIDVTETKKLALDLYRRPEHRLLSRMLHGLELLDVRFGLRLSGPDFVRGVSLERLHEHWEYTFSPATEAALVEASVYGATVTEAVSTKFAMGLSRLEQEGASRSASMAVRKLAEACVLGLHDHVPRLLGWLRMNVGEDAEFTSIAQATTQLQLLWESREPLESAHLDELPALIIAAYERACFLVSELNSTPEASEDGNVAGLLRLRELLAGGHMTGLDPALFWDGLGRISAGALARPVISGAAAGMLFTVGELSEAALLASVEGRLLGERDSRNAVGYLRGVLMAAREIAWQVPGILERLDARLQHWKHDEFLRMLPELRLAFSTMTPQETDRIAASVAGLHGEATLGQMVHHDIAESEAHLYFAASEAVRDALKRDGLGQWLGCEEPA